MATDKIYSPGMRAVDALLLQEDIKSGVLYFQKAKQRVDVATADALASTKQPGVIKALVKSANLTGKSGAFDAMANAHEDLMEKGKLGSRSEAYDFGLDVDYKPGMMISISGL